MLTVFAVKVNAYSSYGVISYSSYQPHHYGNSSAIWDLSVTCHPAEVTFLPLLSSQKLVLDSVTQEGCTDDVVGLVTFQGGTRSKDTLIPVPARLNVEQLWSCDKWVGWLVG